MRFLHQFFVRLFNFTMMHRGNQRLKRKMNAHLVETRARGHGVLGRRPHYPRCSILCMLAGMEAARMRKATDGYRILTDKSG